MTNPLTRTRSQHFVHSPRKVASPLRARLPSGVYHPAQKRRRISSNLFAARTLFPASSEERDSARGEGSRSSRRDSVVGRRGRGGAQGDGESRGRKSKGRRRGGVDSLKEEETEGSLSESSPRKRKRGVVEDEEEEEDSDDEDEDEDEDEEGSWVEMNDDEGDEDEEEPEFIAESDQHLLQEAPAYALHRLRKAELIRLWKVAGMWTTEDEDDGVEVEDDDDDGGLGKKELVDGLIAARKNSSDRKISPLPTSASPRKPLETPFLPHQPSTISPDSSSSSASNSPSSSRPARRRDVDATPRAKPRTRSKVRGRPSDPVARRPAKGTRLNGAKGGDGQARFGYRHRSREGRKARFGDEVKSPGNALALAIRRPRRSSTLSSAYTTTDTSPPPQPHNTSRTPRRARRSVHTPARKAAKPIRAFDRRTSFETVSTITTDDEHAIDDDDDEEEDGAEPTPLVQRLRSRSRSGFVKEMSSEVEADQESEGDGEEEEAEASPSLSRRLRSRDGLGKRPDSDISMGSAGGSKGRRNRPERDAKIRAMEALKGGETDDDVEMVENDGEEEDGDAESPRSGPLTRSQMKAQGVSPPRPTRRTSRHSAPDMEEDEEEDAEGGATAPISEESALTSLSDEEEVTEKEDGEASSARTTRSGKAFGVMRDRRKRLRQEAMDDPDMEVDEDEEEEDEDEDEDGFEAELDLAEATVASLTRLLRDELVQMCEMRGLEVGGTKPQLAKSLIDWRDEQNADHASTASTSSTGTARPASSTVRPKRGQGQNVIHAIASHTHVPGRLTPVLLRDHIHATDPATPPHSDESAKMTAGPGGEAELNLDLQELGLEDSMIKPSQLVKLEKIGSGGFKDVYVGKLRGRKVAIAEFRGHLGEMDIRELKLLAEFSHPNIVRFRGICIPEDSTHIPCMLVSELCENGDLFDYIRNISTPTLKQVLGLMLDIARGLEYLHTRKPSIIHRDCKSSNILINRAGQAKVGDFGLARVKHSTRSMIRSLVGTVNWQAPELWHPSPRYDYKVDVFSAGMVYWEMMSGWLPGGDKKYPWEGHNEHYIYDAVGSKHRRPSVAGLRKHWGAEPVNLMERMWHQDAGERPTMSDVVADLEVLIAEI